MKTTRCGVLSGVILAAGLMAVPAHAQVNINVQIGEPAPVVVQAPPTMILMPEPQMYMVVGVPYDIFFVSGRYYYYNGGHWFWGPGYAGPWAYVKTDKLPKSLRKYKVHQLREFRDREYRVYQVQGPRSGYYFVASQRDDDDDDDNRGGRDRREKRKKDD